MNVGTTIARGAWQRAAALATVTSLMLAMLAVLGSPVAAATISVPAGDEAALRAAIADANDGDVIELAEGTYQLTNDPGPGGSLIIDDDRALTVVGLGAGATIEQTEDNWSVFAVDRGSLTIDNLTLTHSGDGGYGSALYVESAWDRIEILNSTITDNVVSGVGGGIYLDASRTFEDDYGLEVVIRGSRFTGNEAEDEGGAIWMFNYRSLLIEDSVFQGNRASYGGALYIECGVCAEEDADRITIRRTSFVGNQASLDGGAIYLWGWNELLVEGSTFAGNQARFGSAIYLDDWGPSDPFWSDPSQWPASDDDVTIVNSTFSGNAATGPLTAVGDGGAIYAEADVGDVLLRSVTVADNIGGGVFSLTGAEVEIVNSLVVGSMSDDCTGDVVSLGGNIDSDGTCNLDPDLGDQAGVSAADLGLGDLANNGGTTQTHAIDEASVAYASALAGACPATDQRGVARKSPCDVGAFEVPAADDDPDEPEDDEPDDPEDEAPPATPVEAQPTFTG